MRFDFSPCAKKGNVPYVRLAPRECEILSLLLSGNSYRSIAESLDLTEPYVRKVVCQMCEQLGLRGEGFDAPVPVRLLMWGIANFAAVLGDWVRLESRYHYPGCPCELARCRKLRAVLLDRAA